MSNDNLHVADEQLMLHAGGELQPGSSAQIRSHLERCSACRVRAEKLERTMAEFSEAHRDALEADIPAAASARARLQTRLTELAAQDRRHNEENGPLRVARATLAKRRFEPRFGHRQTAVLAAIAVAACLLLAVRLHGPAQRSSPPTASLRYWEEPNQSLTPGATLPLTRNQVCGAAEAALTPSVPVSLKRKVFEEYGVTPPRPDAYEVDYLITPELGGATDIRNLWPEPYRDTVWNAHVKDQLEDRLHRMVCHGDVDLATAQHDISSDWIAAYRKYFRVEAPVADPSSSLTSSESRLSPPLT